MRQFGLVASLAVILCGSVTSFCHAQASPQTPTGVIVLIDGRCYSGAISPVAGGFRIDNGGSYVIIPETHVKLQATSIASAYSMLRERRDPTVNGYLALGEWCFKNGLLEEAREETIKGLTFDPGHQSLLRLLKMIDDRLQPQTSVAKATHEAATPEAMLLMQERSEFGLSRDAHREFISRIQPLLLNTCGNAACHGSASENSFRLGNARMNSSGHRSQSVENLKAILDRIDLENPTESALLRRPTEINGVHHGLFLGDKRSHQLAALQNWVERVSRDHGTGVKQKSFGGSRITQAGAQSNSTLIRPVQPAVHETPVPAAPAAVKAPSASQGTPTLEDPAAALDAIRREQQADPFDPDLFNRRVHGKSAAELRGERG